MAYLLISHIPIQNVRLEKVCFFKNQEAEAERNKIIKLLKKNSFYAYSKTLHSVKKSSVL